jgi:hypothetical protein
MVNPTEIEKKSLEAHVELCAERYTNLNGRITAIDEKVNLVQVTTSKIHDMITEMADKRTTQIIGWGIGVISFLTSIIGYLTIHYIIK